MDTIRHYDVVDKGRLEVWLLQVELFHLEHIYIGMMSCQVKCHSESMLVQ